MPANLKENQENSRFTLEILLYQKNFGVFGSVLCNSPWLLRNLKNVQNETTKLFSVGNTFL